MRRFFLVAAIVAAIAALGVRFYEMKTGTSVLVSQGGKFWIPINERSPIVSESVRLALSGAGPAQPGALRWAAIRPGFETADLDALIDGEVADTIRLIRIDPSAYRFAVHIDRKAQRDLGAWLRETGAAAIVNGSYYDRRGGPATPSVIDGRREGPAQYDASHGAFIADTHGARIIDAKETQWEQAFADADAAFVSYPLLLDEAGAHRVSKDRGWLANRSFIAEDRAGHIIIGTTRDAFFTLAALGEFLGRAPLDLRFALNLDGGPVACLGVRLDDVAQDIYGRWEIQVHDGDAKMLPPLADIKKAPMPIVVAVYPKP